MAPNRQKAPKRQSFYMLLDNGVQGVACRVEGFGLTKRKDHFEMGLPGLTVRFSDELPIPAPYFISYTGLGFRV